MRELNPRLAATENQAGAQVRMADRKVGDQARRATPATSKLGF